MSSQHSTPPNQSDAQKKVFRGSSTTLSNSDRPAQHSLPPILANDKANALAPAPTISKPVDLDHAIIRRTLSAERIESIEMGEKVSV
jgi:hypothetical protein